jgi:phospholipid transport system substrate-binding protein
MKMQACLRLAALLFCLWAPLTSSAQATNAVTSIETLHEELLDVMRNAADLEYGGRTKKLTPVIPAHFDLAFMAEKAIGRRSWKAASETDQERYLTAFTRFMVANYAGRFDGFSGQSFKTVGEEPARSETILVKTQLIDPGQENIELNYRMRKVGDDWKIIDVYMDGTVSELALRRSEFAAVVKRDGFDGLIAALDKKIEKLSKANS